MGGCSIHGCFSRRGDKGITFHKFPSDPSRRTTWLQNCGRPHWDPPKSASICNEHFDENQFELHRADGWKKLKPNAIPTLFPAPGQSNRRRRRSKKTSLKYTPSAKKEEDAACLPSQRPVGLRVQLKKRNKRKTTIPARWRGFEIDNMVKRVDDDEPRDSASADQESENDCLESSHEHGYARHGVDSAAVEMVEVCFSGVKQNDFECSQCTKLKETLSSVIDERDTLQKKINCMNSAIRMVLNKEQRQTIRFVANTISENWIVPKIE